ncbi:glycosyltransferase family 39 protein [uncultured Jannaschia sp.]|uniref:glycosyltransferase family 39 protein n=1 Tax=uncultured Jannaschia sp. TaxID=293347 RepID=UPI002627407C|nr:glycosyltransferase family 39 protein [uncultured Jannaschia sp.]
MRRPLLALSLFFLASHLAIAALVPLFDDEAYYALWARDLSLGYYDHPPMIAYMIRAGTDLLGETSLGIRLLPVVCFAISGYLVGDMARRMSDGGAGVAVLATTLYNLALLVFALSSFATPDAPSTLFWIATLWTALRAMELAPKTPSITFWWACTGLFLGLGGLSKFTNAFLAVGLLSYLLAVPKRRAYLSTRLPYVAMGAALLPLLPYLVWNLQNDWLGLERQGARLGASNYSLRHLGEYTALLLLAPTPLATWFAFRALKAPPRDGALLAWSAAPLLAYFAYHATHAQVQANWIVPLQAHVAILAAFGLVRSHSPRAWASATLGLATAMSVGLIAAAFNPVVPIGRSDNPPNQTRGWPAIRAEIGALLEETSATWIATTDYAMTGSLALRFPQMPVWSVTDLRRYGFRGAFPAELCAATGLLITRAKRPGTISKIAPELFEKVEATSPVIREQNGVTLMHYAATSVSRPRSPALCSNRHRVGSASTDSKKQALTEPRELPSLSE